VSTENKITFKNFGISFQQKLVQIILEERVFADQIEEVLDEGYFDVQYLRFVVREIFKYKEKYELHPTHDAISTIFRTNFDDENEVLIKQIQTFLVRIHKSHVEDADFVKETALDFAKRQKLKEAMIKSISLLQKSSFDEISEVINEALKLGTDTNFGYDWIKDFEERFEIKTRAAISTGWPDIDEICDGGLGQGELGIGIAPSGTGKSMLLVHLGARALMAGKNVVHYTLELSDTVIGSRYDSCITGIPINDLRDNKDDVYQNIRNVPGSLIIKEYPTKKASTKTIKNHLERIIKKGESVDMIIVDYADLLSPISRYKEKRRELESIYEELRGLAQHFACPLWSVSQTNRSGLNQEIITMNSISEAFAKCFVADFIFSLSRTMTDKAKNKGRFFIAKNRFGPDGLVYSVSMDTASVAISVLGQEEINEGMSQRQRKDHLREKYKEFVQSKFKENNATN